MLAGLATFALASLAAALAPTLGFLIVARAVQGASAAVLMALSLALARSAVAKERMGGGDGAARHNARARDGARAFTRRSAGRIFRLARGVSLANVPLALASFAIGARALEREHSRRVESIVANLDLPGALLLAVTLVALLALSTTLGRIAPGPWATLAAVLAALGSVAFVLIERRGGDAPLISFEF